MSPLSDDLRDLVIQRAGGRCEYCLAPLAIVVEMEIDHIVPQSLGGKTEENNLCLACAGCNGYKLAFQEAQDPESGKIVPLFNPRIQQWHEHFAWGNEGTLVVGLTPGGRATISRLRMNRDRMIEARKLWVQAGWHPPHQKKD